LCEMCNTVKPSTNPNNNQSNSRTTNNPQESSSPIDFKSIEPSAAKNFKLSLTDSDSKVLDCRLLCCADLSQFTAGGDSACAFGVLSIAAELLHQRLNFSAQDATQHFAKAIAAATENYSNFYNGVKGAHSSVHEIMERAGDSLYADIEIESWTEIPGSLSSLREHLVFPEVFLSMGEIQVQNFHSPEFIQLLEGFAGGDRVLSVINIGYAFGIYCAADRSFYIFDTHSRFFRSSDRSESISGAYIAQLSSAAKAVEFINLYPLSSRAAILSIASSGVDSQQLEAALKMEIACLKRK
jgi:hypothetical protein